MKVLSSLSIDEWRLECWRMQQLPREEKIDELAEQMEVVKTRTRELENSLVALVLEPEASPEASHAIAELRAAIRGLDDAVFHCFVRVPYPIDQGRKPQVVKSEPLTVDEL